jgi:hypothetical protein
VERRLEAGRLDRDTAARINEVLERDLTGEAPR